MESDPLGSIDKSSPRGTTFGPPILNGASAFPNDLPGSRGVGGHGGEEGLALTADGGARLQNRAGEKEGGREGFQG